MMRKHGRVRLPADPLGLLNAEYHMVRNANLVRIGRCPAVPRIQPARVLQHASMDSARNNKLGSGQRTCRGQQHLDGSEQGVLLHIADEARLGSGQPAVADLVG